MSHAVWRFERSVSETVELLRDVIQRDAGVRASEVRGEWAYRAQLLMEPAGWDALWRLPKEACQKLGVRFPCVVYVAVESLELEDRDGELCASIEVVGVQDDSIHLPARHEGVPLPQLWPVKAQPNSAIDIKPTAEFIDLYRYFYTLIWMPWDLDCDEECGWFERNVPARCALWAAALSNTPGSPQAATLRALKEEADLLAKRIAICEAELPSDTEDAVLDCSGEHVSELVMLHGRLEQVRGQWETLQSPTIRPSPALENLPSQNIVIWTGGCVDAQISCLKSVGAWLRSEGSMASEANAVVQCSPSLVTVLESRPPRGSRLLLCPGIHHLPVDTGIGSGYMIKSVTGDAILRCQDQRTTALAAVGGLTLDNLEIDVNECSTAFAVRSGAAKVNSCKFRSLKGSHDAQAVVVYAGTEITLKKCSLDGFFTGIVAHSGCKIRMEDCTVNKCGVALQIYKGAEVSLVRCVLKDCSEAGIRYETDAVKASEGGGTNLLYRFKDITLTECKFINNPPSHDVYVARLDENACPEWNVAI